MASGRGSEVYRDLFFGWWLSSMVTEGGLKSILTTPTVEVLSKQA